MNSGGPDAYASVEDDSDQESGAENNNNAAENGNVEESSSSNEELGDWVLSLANVSKLVEKALPPDAEVSKEAKETIRECATEFVTYVTCGASDKCMNEKRLSVTGDDLICSIEELGFIPYVGPLKLYLKKFRESVTVSAPSSKSHDRPPPQDPENGADQGMPIHDSPGATSNDWEMSVE